MVRTTTLLRRLHGHITWVSAPNNLELLENIRADLRCVAWGDRDRVLDRRYDLVISLEDAVDTAAFVKESKHSQLFGAYLSGDSHVSYTDDARGWFDLSLISVHGRQQADELKYQNRHSYQELIFGGLGFRFEGEEYVLPVPVETDLRGDVAIAPAAGPVWPMKNWAYYPELRSRLQADGLRVNVLPRRESLLEHLGDIAQHRVLVSGDSLPMHLALGVRTPSVSIFNCTSPWEIFDYGIQTKIISPLLGQYFYKRGLDHRATIAVSLDQVYRATLERLAESPPR